MGVDEKKRKKSGLIVCGGVVGTANSIFGGGCGMIAVPTLQKMGLEEKRAHATAILWILLVLLLGFVAYGLSIHFYIMAQKDLGAAKTSAYYSVAPFLGVAFGMLLVGERPQVQFYVALIIMAISTWLMVRDTIELQHDQGVTKD